MPSFPFPESIFVPLPMALLLFPSRPFSANCLFSGLTGRKFSNSFCQGEAFFAWLLFIIVGNYHKYYFFVATKVLSRQTCVCDKHTSVMTKPVLSQQKYACHDKTFVATKMLLVAAPTNVACWVCCLMALLFAIRHSWTILKLDCFCLLLF